MPSRSDEIFSDLRAAGFTGSRADMERQRALNILGLSSSKSSLSDLRAQINESPNFAVFDPFRLPNLELALDSTRLSGTLFSDSFGRPDGNTAAPWTVTAPGNDFIISGGALTVQSSGTQVAWIDAKTTDHDIEAIVQRPTTASNLGITSRYTDNSNKVWLDIAVDGTYRLAKFVAGVVTTLTPAGQGASTADRRKLRLVTRGSYVAAWVDDVLVYEDATAISDVPSSTKVGIRSNAAVGYKVYFFKYGIPTYVDGSALPMWIDLSGKGRHVTQSDPTKQPKYRKANPNLAGYNESMGYYGASPQGDVTVSLDTTTQIEGPNSWKCVAGAVPAINTGINVVGSTPATPGNTYSFSMKIKQPVGTTRLSFQVLFRDAASGITGAFNAPSVYVGNTLTELKLENLVAPAGTTKVSWKVLFADVPVTGDTYYAGAWMMNDGATVKPFVRPVKLPNSRATVQFDGVDDTLSNSFGDILSPLTIYGIVQTNDVTPNQKWVSSMNATTRLMLMMQAGATYGYGTSTRNSGSLAGLDTENHVFTVQSSVASILQSRDGQVKSLAGDATDSYLMTGVAVGSQTNSSGFTNGQVAAVLVFSTAHDDATRKRIEKWLGNKYGIAVA